MHLLLLPHVFHARPSLGLPGVLRRPLLAGSWGDTCSLPESPGLGLPCSVVFICFFRRREQMTVTSRERNDSVFYSSASVPSPHLPGWCYNNPSRCVGSPHVATRDSWASSVCASGNRVGRRRGQGADAPCPSSSLKCTLVPTRAISQLAWRPGNAPFPESADQCVNTPQTF